MPLFNLNFEVQTPPEWSSAFKAHSHLWQTLEFILTSDKLRGMLTISINQNEILVFWQDFWLHLCQSVTKAKFSSSLQTATVIKTINQIDLATVPMSSLSRNSKVMKSGTELPYVTEG